MIKVFLLVWMAWLQHEPSTAMFPNLSSTVEFVQKKNIQEINAYSVYEITIDSICTINDVTYVFNEVMDNYSEEVKK